jgi:hypothetical protein
LIINTEYLTMQREKVIAGYHRLNSADHYATISKRNRRPGWEVEVRRNDGSFADNGEITTTLREGFEAAERIIKRIEL